MVTRFPITLNQLTYFVACATTLNMTVASQELHVAQSAISTAITQLERALGAPLFIRKHAKGLALTPAGTRFLHDANRMFELLGESIDALQQERGSVRGVVRVAVFSTLAPFLLPPLIAELQRAHPELELELLEGDYESTTSALRDGRADLAIAYDLTEAPDLDVERFAEARPYVLVAADHALAGRESVRLAELADEPFVLLDLPESNEYFLGILRRAGVSPVLRHRSRNVETVRSVVAAGLGFTMLNQRPVTGITYSGAQTAAIEIDGEAQALTVTIASLKQTGRSARARAVAEAVREVIWTTSNRPLD